MTPEEIEEQMQEFEMDVNETAEVDGVPLYDPEDERETRAINLDQPAAPAEIDVDPLADSDEDDKPEAKTRTDALAELRSTLVSMVDNPKYADRKVPGTALVTPGDVFDECHLRSRPWVSGELSRILMTGGDVQDGVVAERHGDPRKGGYRLRRTGGVDHSK